MKIAREEIFGPVLSVLTYDSVAQAIAIANDSEYGLSGAVYTRDMERGVAVARQISTGVVELNGAPAGMNAPFGGVKNSGIGREGGPEGLEPYTEIKTISLPRSFAEELYPRARPSASAMLLDG
jgi:acyl-CoA reductase-like NAD-dependent aldehyde dehydrogenase